MFVGKQIWSKKNIIFNNYCFYLFKSASSYILCHSQLYMYSLATFFASLITFVSLTIATQSLHWWLPSHEPIFFSPAEPELSKFCTHILCLMPLAIQQKNNTTTPRLFLQLSNIVLNMQIQFSDFVVQCVERWKLLFFYLLRCSAAPLCPLCSYCLCFLSVFLELSTLSVYFAYCHSPLHGHGHEWGTYKRMLRAHIKFNFVFEFRSKS